jgi:hypothetical protein
MFWERPRDKFHSPFQYDKEVLTVELWQRRAIGCNRLLQPRLAPAEDRERNA